MKEKYMDFNISKEYDCFFCEEFRAGIWDVTYFPPSSGYTRVASCSDCIKQLSNNELEGDTTGIFLNPQHPEYHISKGRKALSEAEGFPRYEEEPYNTSNYNTLMRSLLSTGKIPYKNLKNIPPKINKTHKIPMFYKNSKEEDLWISLLLKYSPNTKEDMNYTINEIIDTAVIAYKRRVKEE